MRSQPRRPSARWRCWKGCPLPFSRIRWYTCQSSQSRGNIDVRRAAQSESSIVSAAVLFQKGGICVFAIFRSCRGIAQPGRALRSGRRGRRFESSFPDHHFKKPLCGVAFLRATPSGFRFSRHASCRRRISGPQPLSCLARRPAPEDARIVSGWRRVGGHRYRGEWVLDSSSFAMNGAVSCRVRGGAATAV